MFSLHERQEEQDPSQPRPNLLHRFPANVKFHAPLAALAFALVVVLIYGLHERSVAAHSSAQNAEATAQLA